MAVIRDAIVIDKWARAQHREHTNVQPEWCPLCHAPEPEPPSPAAPGARPATCRECGDYTADEVCAAVTCPQRTPRPRYRLTPEGIIPCITPAAATPPIVPTLTPSSSPLAPASTVRNAAPRLTSGATARRAVTSNAARLPKRHGPLGQMLDRLQALGCVFCDDCYAYAWPDHVAHLTKGPIVPLGTVTLAEPIVAEGLDGQSEFVTLPTPEEHAA